VIRIW